MMPLRMAPPSLVTSAAATLPAPPPAQLMPPLPLQLAAQPLQPLGAGSCSAAATGGYLPQEVAQARAQMEALRLTQQPNQWVLLPQRLLEQHVPQLLAAALAVGGLAQQQQAPHPLQLPAPQAPLMVHAPLPVPRVRGPGSGLEYFSLLQGEFDGSGI